MHTDKTVFISVHLAIGFIYTLSNKPDWSGNQKFFLLLLQQKAGLEPAKKHYRRFPNQQNNFSNPSQLPTKR